MEDILLTVVIMNQDFALERELLDDLRDDLIFSSIDPYVTTRSNPNIQHMDSNEQILNFYSSISSPVIDELFVSEEIFDDQGNIIEEGQNILDKYYSIEESIDEMKQISHEIAIINKKAKKSGKEPLDHKLNFHGLDSQAVRLLLDTKYSMLIPGQSYKFKFTLSNAGRDPEELEKIKTICAEYTNCIFGLNLSEANFSYNQKELVFDFVLSEKQLDASIQSAQTKKREFEEFVENDIDPDSQLSSDAFIDPETLEESESKNNEKRIMK